MDDAPEGEQLNFNFTMVVLNFIGKYDQYCQSSLISGAEMSFLRAKGKLDLIYFASFV